jgi:ABC-2 type transport system ATP-binding protein
MVAPVTPRTTPEDSLPAAAAVRMAGITKRFPVRRGWVQTLRRPFSGESTLVLRDVSVDVLPGEFFGLLGPNGAGKTTLFKVLATLVLPDDGTAIIEGYDILEQPDEVRRVLTPVIADERSLHWRLTARENLRLFATLQGLDRDESRTRIDEVMIATGIADSGTKLAGSFSSGMKQRLLIARALLARPRVLLLDEPTRSLDPVSARDFRTFLREEITGRQGCTVILATHNAEEALELCDRVAVLDRGRLLEVGRASKLVEEYGEESYRVWTRTPEHPAFAALGERGVEVEIEHDPSATDGWTRVRLELSGGHEAASRALDLLTTAGVPVARFERVGLSLAELMERIVERRGARKGEADGAGGDA